MSLVTPESNDDKLNARVRLTVLVLLCCQNAGHALLTRYSRVSMFLVAAYGHTVNNSQAIFLFFSV